MAPPRHINLDEQAVVGSASTAVLADHAVTNIKLAAGAVDANALAINSVTPTKLAASIYGLGLIANGITSAIDVNVDNITLQIVSDVVKTKSIILENFANDPTAGTPGRLIWRTDLLQVRIDDGVAFSSLTGGGGSGHTIEDEGIALTQRSTLNFVGAGVTVTDVGGKTQVSVPQGGHTISDEGTPLTQRAVLNFVGTGVTVTDGGTETTVTVSSGSTAQYAKDLLTVSNPTGDHTIVLSNTPQADSEILSLNGLILQVGATHDYTISGNTVTINAGVTLTVGDNIMIVYAY